MSPKNDKKSIINLIGIENINVQQFNSNGRKNLINEEDNHFKNPKSAQNFQKTN